MSEKEYVNIEKLVKDINLRIIYAVVVFFIGLGWWGNVFYSRLQSHEKFIGKQDTINKHILTALDTIKNRQERYMINIGYQIQDINKEVSRKADKRQSFVGVTERWVNGKLTFEKVN